MTSPSGAGGPARSSGSALSGVRRGGEQVRDVVQERRAAAIRCPRRRSLPPAEVKAARGAREADVEEVALLVVGLRARAGARARPLLVGQERLAGVVARELTLLERGDEQVRDARERGSGRGWSLGHARRSARATAAPRSPRASRAPPRRVLDRSGSSARLLERLGRERRRRAARAAARGPRAAPARSCGCSAIRRAKRARAPNSSPVASLPCGAARARTAPARARPRAPRRRSRRPPRRTSRSSQSASLGPATPGRAHEGENVLGSPGGQRRAQQGEQAAARRRARERARRPRPPPGSRSRQHALVEGPVAVRGADHHRDLVREHPVGEQPGDLAADLLRLSTLPGGLHQREPVVGLVPLGAVVEGTTRSRWNRVALSVCRSRGVPSSTLARASPPRSRRSW